MPRTDSTTVQDVLGGDYDLANAPALAVKMLVASRIVDRLVLVAAGNGVVVDAATATDIETYLAAHLYAISDKPFQSKSTEGASASFIGRTDMALDATLYGQTAKVLDFTGYLNTLGKPGVNVGGFWGGTTATEAQTWDQRN